MKIFVFLLAIAIGFPAWADDCTTLGAHASQAITGPDDVCKLVTNTTNNSLCVTTYNAAEWQSFYNHPGSATVAACQCSAGTATWATHCSAPVAALTYGSNTNVTNTASGFTGSATVTCSNGSYGYTGTSCNAITCGSQSVTWGSCSGTATGPLAYNGTQSVTNTAGGSTGAVTVSCGGAGTLSQSGASCNPITCGTQGVTWGSCSGTATGPIAYNGTRSVTNTASGDTGSVTVTCGGTGTLNQSGASCSPITCGSQSVTWGSCSGNATGPIAYNGTQNVLNTAGSSTGSVTVTCGGTGTLSQSGASCSPITCGVQSVTWGSCSGSSGSPIAYNATKSVTNTAGGSTGSVTLTCGGTGTLSQSGATCNPVFCASQLVTWEGALNNPNSCSGTMMGPIAYNSTQSVSSTAGGYTGSVTVTCGGTGTLSQSGATCNPIAWTQMGNQCASYGYTTCSPDSISIVATGCPSAGSLCQVNAPSLSCGGPDQFNAYKCE